jgi:hypothetical protein
MAIRIRPRLAGMIAATFAASAILSAQGVPFWGARESSPIGTDAKLLKPGQFIWDANAAPRGPIVIVVSLPEQIARVYRNGVEIGVARVSTGKPGHTTPTGVFTILNKDREHRSKTYDNAPMPWSERLTWDGIALHAGGVPGYPESHGCVHLPSRFAELLFGITEVGLTVIIANDVSAPVDVSHPSFLAPVSAKGVPDEEPRLSDDAVSRWEPDKAPEGPTTVVVSSADKRILVLRNGVEIGRARVVVDDPEKPIGTMAFILQEDSAAPVNPDSPPGMRWIGISLPGSSLGGTAMDRNAAARVRVPPSFAAGVVLILKPGATLYVTDAPVLPSTTGPALNVLNSDPPPARPAP